MAKKYNSTLLIIIGSLVVAILLFYLISLFNQNTNVSSTTINDSRAGRPRYKRSSYNYMYSHRNSPGERSNWFGPGGTEWTHHSSGQRQHSGPGIDYDYNEYERST